MKIAFNVRKELLKKYLPEIIGTFWLCFYVYLKYRVVAAGLARFEVNPHFFLFLDAATIPVYVWCSGQLIRRLYRKVFSSASLIFAVGVFSFFILPYIYLFVAGRQKFPALVWLALIAFVVAGLLFSIYQMWCKVKSA